MARLVYYDEQCGFVPYDDCPQDNLYSESEAKHTFSPSEPKTNADRIRAMTDEELARWISETKITGCPGDLTYTETMCDVLSCYDCWLEWLKAEATE